MGDNVFRFDLVGAHQVGNWRVGTGLVVVKQAHAFAFEKADTEAVGVVVSNAAATAEAFKRKHDVCGRVAIHAEQLAHGVNLYFWGIYRVIMVYRAGSFNM